MFNVYFTFLDQYPDMIIISFIFDFIYAKTLRKRKKKISINAFQNLDLRLQIRVNEIHQGISIFFF